MAVEGTLHYVKYLLFLVNFIFWLCGLGLIVLGILLQIAVHNTFKIHDPSASGAPIVLIAVGVIIFFVTFFGCRGAWKENAFMLNVFSILLSLIIAVEIGGIIAGHLFRNKIKDIVHDSLTDLIDNYTNSSKEFQFSVDKLQIDLKCCGVNSSADWQNFDADGITVPDSCCLSISENCGKGAMMDASKVHIQGCMKSVQLLLHKNIIWIIVAVLITAIVQVSGVAFGCMLRRGIRNRVTYMV